MTRAEKLVIERNKAQKPLFRNCRDCMHCAKIHPEGQVSCRSVAIENGVASSILKYIPKMPKKCKRWTQYELKSSHQEEIFY